VKLAAGFFVVLLALPAHTGEEAALQDALRKFSDDFARGPGNDERIAAIRTLCQFKSERVVKTLSPSLTKGTLQVRMAVAHELGAFPGIPVASEALVGALRSYESSGKNTDGIRIHALRSLGQLRSKDSAAEVDKLILDKSHWVQKAAIDAAGLIRVKCSIEPLIRALRRIEGPDGNGQIAVNPLLDEMPPVSLAGIVKQQIVEQARPKSERDVLAEPILTSLKSITRANFGTAKDWEGWWSKNKPTFKVPE
jgi:hypothetical protein